MEDNERCGMTVSRIFCIGRNYVEHARELNNPVPEAPVVFMKPPTCLVKPGEPVHFPSHGRDLHHEAELVVRIGREGRARTGQEACSFVQGLAVGLDLTLRDVQTELKRKGMPWERAKAFDQSAPMGEVVPWDGSFDLDRVRFTCTVNNTVRQTGNSGDMIFNVDSIILALSSVWTLKPGDLIFTGTPAGVGPLAVGDTITVESPQLGTYSWDIVE